MQASAGQTREEVEQHVTLAKPLRSKHTLPRDTLGGADVQSLSD